MTPSTIFHYPLPVSFSQLSLQDYADCRRCFQLRHVFKLRWPAVESEPALENERAMQQGARFHRLVQHHFMGISAEQLLSLARSDGFERWWQHFLDFARLSGFEKGEGAAFYPEISLAASLPGTAGGGRRLVAKYDLLVIHPDGRLAIYDWKTSRKKPRRAWLLERLQTRVYPYVLACAGAHLFPHGVKLAPENIEMIYWFAEEPDGPERIAYSAAMFKQDGAYLAGLVDEIVTLAPEDFHLTAHTEHCRFCTYRSLCNRGRAAGDWEEVEDEPEPVSLAEFDFEQIAEIAF
ncbi:MAG: PD-(D/E)XK nuclease family protein [Chloroflexota bacterium]